MLMVPFSVQEDYWENTQIENEDIESLYTHLLEIETPLTSNELIKVLVDERIQREIKEAEEQRLSGGDVFFPKESYKKGQMLVFSALDWKQGEVIETRPGQNPEFGEFDVIKVKFDDGDTREFASNLTEHTLNEPISADQAETPDKDQVFQEYGDLLVERLEENLEANDDFVWIAGKWFPRALMIDVNAGHLNLAEAILDMSEGGPLPTSSLLEQIELGADDNPKLVEFSLDLALQEDPRFDEVGPAGKVLWFLHRLEPENVRITPPYLRYDEVDYDRSILSTEMLALERELDDELSPIEEIEDPEDEVTIRLLYPHLHSGTLPLTKQVSSLFPTAYVSPRIMFTMIDGDSDEKYQAWVVRKEGYVYGLKQWYEDRGLIPGSLIRVKKGKKPGEVFIEVDTQRASRDWLRTVLVGSDGGIVFATLKQVVTAAYDDRMAISIPDEESLVAAWEKTRKTEPPFERIVVNMVRELTKLNPQGHVHISELYAVTNLVRRCPPAPIMTLLSSRPWFVHVGDLHFRFDDSEIDS